MRASGRWALVALVAEREVRERARSKTFRISTAVTIVLVAGIVALSGKSDTGPGPLPVGVVGRCRRSCARPSRPR